MVKSPIPDVQIPNITVHELAFEHFRAQRNKVALIDGASGRSYTYSDLLRMCRSVASALVRLGAKKGDVLAIHSPNTPEYAIMFLGAASAGVTLTTINPTYTVYEVTKQLEDSGATFMYTIETFLPVAQQAANKYGKIKKMIVLGKAPGLVSFLELVKDDGKAFPLNLTFDPANDVLTLPYSSGTTGLSKGVVLTHRNVVANFCQYRHEELQADVITKYLDSGKQLTILGLLPFYHSYGQMVIMLFTLMSGYRIVTLTHFEPELFLTAIQKYKINMLALVPPLIIFLAKSPLVKQFDLSSIIATVSGAAPLSRDTEDEACKVLGITDIFQGYGLTETSPVATIVPRGFVGGQKRGSVGVPVPNSEIQIVEVGSSKVLGPKQTGEVWIKGPHIMKGYLNKPQATRETIDKEGWLHTGDIGYYDEDGFFYIVDRIKELIKYKGFQVPPAELEGLLLTHPDVADAGVIGIPDAEAGELPKAFIVRKQGHTVTTAAIQAFVKEYLTGYKQLRGGVEFVDQIPKTASGKIIRRELAKMHNKTKSKL